MDNTQVTQVTSEVIETNSASMATIRATQASSEIIEQSDRIMNSSKLTFVANEVIETQYVRYDLRVSQLAVEVILTRYDVTRQFIGWGVPL